MPILLNDNLDVNAPRPTDNRFGPFANTDAALAGVPAAQRYIGLTVGVLDISNVVTEYWFRNGIANSDFIIKTTGGSGISITGDGGFANSTIRILASLDGGYV